MADEIKVNRSAASNNQSPVSEVRERMESPSASKMPWVVLAVVVIVLIVLGVLFRDKLFGAKSGTMAGSTSTAKASGYQAVFLTNGQVYFGKLSDSESNYLNLKDIYYLQVVQQPPLQGQQTAGQQAATPAQQPQISLVKLGNELHGPADEMHIARSQVLFYEDMKNDSQVVKAIQAYKANPTGTPAAPAPAK